jgi:glycerophosphoryl diester phosphodiesterase
VHLGPRPLYLVDRMAPGPLQARLQACATKPVAPSRFSIGHRGAPLQFPEHTRESYLAAARMGAGVLECDVTFTSDATLVCRHAQCDLHATTNILRTPLAARCAEPFTPATFDAKTGARLTEASARCCASDLTLAEFRSLEGRMDGVNRQAASVAQFLDATPAYRTDLYATVGTLMTHAESIALFDGLGVHFTPELKSARAGFGDSTLDAQRYAAALIQDYVSAGIDPARVWPQSFNREDVAFWIREYPAFGRQAVLLDGRRPAEMAASPPPVSSFQAMKREGINIIAPPIPTLLALDGEGALVPSQYARNAREAGLALITWTLERSGRIVEDVLGAPRSYYYQGIRAALRSDGDVFTLLDVLAREVGVQGVFSDWPATTTYYANCMAPG